MRRGSVGACTVAFIDDMYCLDDELASRSSFCCLICCCRRIALSSFVRRSGNV